MVRLLLEQQANVNARDQRKRSAPLHFVAGSGRYHTGLGDGDSHTIARLLVASGADVDATDSGGSTALHIAVDTKDERLVEALLDSGARLDVRDEYGNTALHVLLLTAQGDCCGSERLERIAGMLVGKGCVRY